MMYSKTKLLLFYSLIALIFILVVGMFLILRNKKNGQTQPGNQNGFVTITPFPTNGIQHLSIIKTTPLDKAINIPLSSDIFITFNSSQQINQVTVNAVPAIQYTQSILGNTLVLTLSQVLQSNTKYQISTSLPGGSPYTFSFTTIGNTITPSPDTRDTNLFNKIKANEREKSPDVYVSNNSPYHNQDFSISYNFVSGTPTGHFHFTVILLNPDKNVVQASFINWLKSLDMTDEQIQRLDITYQ